MLFLFEIFLRDLKFLLSGISRQNSAVVVFLVPLRLQSV
jgi:hypothetical protein